MVGNPNIPQGTLNRLRGSMSFPSYPGLNITAPFLGRDGIRLSFDGQTTMTYGTMSGTIQSPEPYQMATATVHLLKTNGLAQAFENQRLLNSVIGPATIVTDTPSLGAYNLNNCAIANVRELSFSGTDPVYAVTITGYYGINNTLWSF